MEHEANKPVEGDSWQLCWIQNVGCWGRVTNTLHLCMGYRVKHFLDISLKSLTKGFNKPIVVINALKSDVGIRPHLE